jgi:hypothetical protein
MNSHLSDEQLARFNDGELAAGDVAHMEACEHCAGRLREMASAVAAYIEYRDTVRAPLLPPPPQSWPTLDTLIARNASNSRLKLLRWWPRLAIAAACAAIIALILQQTILQKTLDRPSTRASELLARSAMVITPGGRLISLRSGGRTFIRPAVLGTDAPGQSDAGKHLRSLFVAAHYSWRDPLSARSFRDWRNGLRDKRDSVSVIRQSGKEGWYRVRTDSSAGVLQSASITLRAADLYPMDETFAFRGEEPLELTDAPVSAPESAAKPQHVQESRTEVSAGPEDILHVLAALDAIGADVEDPIDVSQDPGHRQVLVRGSGLAPERKSVIADSLKALPRVVLQLDAGPSASTTTQPSASRKTAERASADIPPDFRHELEERFGGAVALQQVTDRVLESSASILARAHALQTLAQNFPPVTAQRMPDRDRDLLRKLQQHHVAELRRVLLGMKSDLQPLLGASANAPSVANTDWQSAVPSLVAAGQNADDLLNRLLAGSYTQVSGSGLLHDLPSAIQRLEANVEAQEREDR